ncbi:MAG: hypothetical protein HN833_02705 [Elusimicrobiaceae bacterium]|nr:hypothetical protein [Elusimicrobiaceae bacterium]MBT4007749.1 hypothetical protein [Elusimicrobiaceae bacterium]MBT4403165.1 hypothetical protein [Elusimicrobiaceae bacterium]MBT4439326.1 hypothetical protein [Elusimicrobiaceae bacterium]MBT5987832.1 hypothetical protein [Elusimicrobiaceae bacterium]
MKKLVSSILIMLLLTPNAFAEFSIDQLVNRKIEQSVLPATPIIPKTAGKFLKVAIELFQQTSKKAMKETVSYEQFKSVTKIYVSKLDAYKGKNITYKQALGIAFLQEIQFAGLMPSKTYNIETIGGRLNVLFNKMNGVETINTYKNVRQIKVLIKDIPSYNKTLEILYANPNISLDNLTKQVKRYLIQIEKKSNKINGYKIKGLVTYQAKDGVHGKIKHLDDKTILEEYKSNNVTKKFMFGYLDFGQIIVKKYDSKTLEQIGEGIYSSTGKLIKESKNAGFDKQLIIPKQAIGEVPNIVVAKVLPEKTEVVRKVEKITPRPAIVVEEAPRKGGLGNAPRITLGRKEISGQNAYFSDGIEAAEKAGIPTKVEEVVAPKTNKKIPEHLKHVLRNSYEDTDQRGKIMKQVFYEPIIKSGKAWCVEHGCLASQGGTILGKRYKQSALSTLFSSPVPMLNVSDNKVYGYFSREKLLFLKDTKINPDISKLIISKAYGELSNETKIIFEKLSIERQEILNEFWVMFIKPTSIAYGGFSGNSIIFQFAKRYDLTSEEIVFLSRLISPRSFPIKIDEVNMIKKSYSENEAKNFFNLLYKTSTEKPSDVKYYIDSPIEEKPNVFENVHMNITGYDDFRFLK